MTAWRTILPLGLLIAGLAGLGACDSDAPPGPDEVPCEPIGGGPVTEGSRFERIDYNVTGGFTGDGDGSSLQLAPDGTVTRTTRLGGTEQGRLDAATFDDLVRTARAAQLPTLCPLYDCDGCADVYVREVSVQFDGTTYRVQASDLAPSLPAGLDALLGTIQDVVEQPLP
jgi:hypothetical protein